MKVWKWVVYNPKIIELLESDFDFDLLYCSLLDCSWFGVELKMFYCINKQSWRKLGDL